MALWIPPVMWLVASGCSAPPGEDSGPASVTISTFRAGAAANTDLVAIQDGDGPWTALTGTGGVYTAQINSARYGVAMACRDPSSNDTEVTLQYATRADTMTWYLESCAVAAPLVTVTGTIAGLGANPVRVSSAVDSAEVVPPATTFTLSALGGAQRLIAEELVNDEPIRLVALDATLADGGRVDLDLTTGMAPVSAPLTVVPASAQVTVWYRDVHGLIAIEGPRRAGASYLALPAGKLGAGIQRMSVSTSQQGFSQTAIRYFQTPASKRVEVPAALALARPQWPVAHTTPYPTVTATIPAVASATAYDFTASTAGAAARFWSVTMTRGWAAALTGSQSISYTLPDLRAVAGWQASYQLAPGIPISWSLSATRSPTVGLAAARPPSEFPYHDGDELDISYTGGEIPSP